MFVLFFRCSLYWHLCQFATAKKQPNLRCFIFDCFCVDSIFPLLYAKAFCCVILDVTDDYHYTSWLCTFSQRLYVLTHPLCQTQFDNSVSLCMTIIVLGGFLYRFHKHHHGIVNCYATPCSPCGFEILDSNVYVWDSGWICQPSHCNRTTCTNSGQCYKPTWQVSDLQALS